MTDVTDQTADDVTTDAPKDNLVRHVEFRAKPSDDGLTLDGYAAVFNEWTEIDSYEGQFRERIAPGAFKRTIGIRTPVLQFDHGSHPLIGSIPLGRITSITEDSHGLRVKARLSDNWLVEPVRDAIRDGAIEGMSFRFRVTENGDRWTRNADGVLERTITDLELYEAGPVVFPAYEQTSVGVRSRQTLVALQDPEVRSEVARILANGTDLASLADVAAPPDEARSDDANDPADGHSEAARTSPPQVLLTRIEALRLAANRH
jgi:HK97 family phage prohead protease